MSSGSRPTDNTTEAMSRRKWRARVARGAERRLDREEAEHDAVRPGATCPGTRARASHLLRHAHHVEQRVREREPEKRHDGPRARAYTTAAPAPAAASGSPLAVAAGRDGDQPHFHISPSDSSTHT